MNEIIIDALAVLLDKDYSIYQKKGRIAFTETLFYRKMFYRIF